MTGYNHTIWAYDMQLDLTAISTVVGLGSIVIGIIATLHSIRRFTRARKLSIYLEFNRILHDIEFIEDMNEIQTWTWENVEEFYVKYGADPNPKAFAKYIRVSSYFDGLSTLVQRNYIDFVPETTAIMLIRFWEKFEPTADGFAMVYKRPGSWDSIKHLYDRLHKIEYQYDREQYEKRLEDELGKTDHPNTD
ncbi:MAG: DUF4760 domain-containing protein [Candidatus Thorarchaeota archaeon]